MATTIEGEDRVMAAAQRIVQSLNNTPGNMNIRQDMISIFSNFDNRLSNITDLMSATGDAQGDARFEAAERIILRWDSNGGDSLLPWEDSPDEAAEYLAAVDEILQLTEDLTIQSKSDIIDRADTALQLAMSRLEDEFRHILIRSTLPLDADRLHGSIRRDDRDFDSVSVVDDDNDERRQASLCLHDRGESLGDDLFVELISPDSMDELKDIADRMIRSGYEKECCQVYISVRRDVLDECMAILGAEKLSIEEVQRIDWKILDEKMKKWVQAVKIVVKVLLAGEKWICEQIFSQSELTQEVCFVETAKGCVMQLLNFGEAVVIGKRSPEKLFRIIDMYDVMFDVLPHLESMFTTDDDSDELGELVCSEAKVLLTGLGEAAIGTFVEFENALLGESSIKQMQGGEIHPLTRYVMNYATLLVDYSGTLNALLANDDEEYTHESSHHRSQSASAAVDDADVDEEEEASMSPIAIRLLRLITSLESNLDEKSKLYDDKAMQYIFLMNNILYMVQKVKDSDLRKMLGDQWIRKRRGQVRQYATSYLRASWSKVLSCLKDEGIGGSSNASSKAALKERFKNFNANFEDIYRIQTGWRVSDVQLREELRISISEKVLPAYRSFMGRFGSQLESGRHTGKYIKFTPDDLEIYLLDLFEGTPIIINHMRRKST
jgi:exocyst complex protein 7